jgi:hypothetical protein
VEDPGPRLRGQVQAAAAAVSAGRTALDGARLVTALDALEAGAQAAEAAGDLSYAYRSGIIDTGERQVRVLEFTRNASFVALGVLAIVATGGAAAAAAGAGGGGAAAAGSTATAFGVNLGVGTATAANVIATGAPIVATLGEAGVRAAVGDEVDWGKVAADVAVSLILARFGGRLANGVFAQLGGNAAVQSMGRVAFTRAFAAVVTHEASTAFTAAVEATYARLRGRRVTWGHFLADLGQRLADPRGIVIAAIMGGAIGVVESRTGQAAQRAASQTGGGAGTAAGTATGPGERSTRGTTAPGEQAARSAQQQRGAVATPAESTTTTRPSPGANLRRDISRAVQEALERPVAPETRAQIEGEVARLRPLLGRVEAARRDPGSLTPQHRRALAEAEAEIEALRFGPSSTIRREGLGGPTVTAWREGAAQARAWAEAGEELTLERIVALNRLLRGADPAAPGPGLRQVDVSAAGQAARQYVPAEDVEPAMRQFLAWYNAARATTPPVELAAQSYQRLVSIHPFEDANGRTTRLVMDWIMRANGLPETPMPKGTHNVAVFGFQELVAPGSGVTPDTVALNLLRGLRETLARIPESIRGPMP